MKIYTLNILFILLSFSAFSQDEELTELEKELATAKHDTSRINAYLKLGVYYQSLEKTVAQLDSSFKYINKAMKIASNYPFFLRKIFNNLGSNYLYKYENTLNSTFLDSSIIYYEKAKLVSQKYKDEEYYLKASWNEVNTLSNSDKIQLFYIRAFSLIKHIEQKSEMSRLDSLVIIKCSKRVCIMYDFDLHSKTFDKYLNLGKRFQSVSKSDSLEISVLEFEQLTDLGRKADIKNVLKNYESIKDVNTSGAALVDITYFLSNYYFKIGDYRKSINLLNSSIDDVYYLENQIDKNERLLTYQLLLGKNYFEIKDYGQAKYYLELADKSVQPSNSNYYELYETYAYLSKVNQKIGNLQKALFFNEKADEMKDKFFGIRMQSLVAEKEAERIMANEEKKTQDALHQADLKAKEAEVLQKQKTIFILLFIAALLTSIWAIYSFIRKRQLSQRLTRQNEFISLQAEELKESNLLKDKIFAVLGHDLRSPVNRLIYSLGGTSENMGDRLELVKDELQNVNIILNNVLHWAKMQLKSAKPEKREVFLSILVREVLEEFEKVKSQKNIAIINQIEANQILFTDESSLKIVIRNVLSNALKFTSEGGYIRISSKLDPNGDFVLHIKDTGIGIDQDKIENVTSYPKSTIGTDGEKGLGLGLSLCKEIMKMLDGNINLKSKENSGTEVILSFIKSI